jgi:hypothetical protein
MYQIPVNRTSLPTRRGGRAAYLIVAAEARRGAGAGATREAGPRAGILAAGDVRSRWPDGRYRGAMNPSPTTVVHDLLAEAPIPKRGIHSQTLSDEGGVELVLFAFASGERLSEHTSARPAIIHVLAGTCDMTVGD